MHGDAFGGSMMGNSASGTDPSVVLDFWFDDAHRTLWFRSTPEFDALARRCFADLWRTARSGSLSHWADSPDGALALVILLDQLPLNMFRGRPEAFATEAAARTVADAAIARGFDTAMTESGRLFLYLPFMHSEDPRDQDRSVTLFESAGMEHNLRWARHHRDIVRRFGRFPHRNAILGRPSTREEEQWLASPEAFTG